MVPEPKPEPRPPEPKETPAEIDPALKLQRALDAKYAQALEPVEAMVSAWDCSAAVAALAKVKFDESELMSRRNARGKELQRLVRLKERMIAKINTAEQPLKKSDLMLRGINGEVAKAEQESVTAKLASGKTESFAWGELGSKAPERLVRMVIDRQKPDDWLAAGLLALVSGDASSAEKHFEKARSLGADIGPYLPPLAAAAFAQTNALMEKGEFSKADAGLAKLVEEYANTPWFAANKASLAAARAAAKTGIHEAQAERLFGEAVSNHVLVDVHAGQVVLERLVLSLNANAIGSVCLSVGSPDVSIRACILQGGRHVTRGGKAVTPELAGCVLGNGRMDVWGNRDARLHLGRNIWAYPA